MGAPFVDSEVGRLREVLMHVPGDELDLISDSNYLRYLFRAGPVDKREFAREVEGVIDVYRSEGVVVRLVSDFRDKPNAVYARDPFFMTPRGAVISNFRYDVRRGEEAVYARAIRELGYPVVKEMGPGEVFEGGNALLLGRGVAIVGVGERTNRAGARALAEVLGPAGFGEVIEVQTPMNVIHVDEYVAQIDEETLLVVRQMFPSEAAERLRELGFDVMTVEYSQLPGGVTPRLCLNMVALRPRRVVMASGCDSVRRALESEGVDVIEVKVDEVLKGGGGVHCITGVLRRDPVGGGAG